MKFLIILAVCATCAFADVSHVLAAQKLQQSENPDMNANVLEQELEVGPDGSYQWSYKTDNGIQAQAQGYVKDAEGPNPAQNVQGQASWTSPNGEAIEFSYIADENGYQPQGLHLPTPPPIPEAIQKALKYIMEHPPQVDEPKQ